jgi:hypothetical protein
MSKLTKFKESAFASWNMRLHFRTVHEFIEYTSFKGLAPDCIDSKLGCMLYNDSQHNSPTWRGKGQQ